ncbi:MAG: bifunctional 2-polyprenyl-6-hydroxyphenol methylase/3-demethylubiquinol 3-O-methyltransferase UbiG [Alphaproteobacteria bacterium]|jgi:2-polyprenyl-6-hydroxyphenyl methylase/3-demethylubiquinone-9 3-methyltransferase|nr:bifunctional 2-polyprenyl-6-hydroxyphenol methylase/3-demethylubiquinol 3-O-methyltransferase UbiG [Alphaproteobacteria bacterium]
MKNEKKNTEFEHFSSLANDWWSKNGKFKILHEIQAIRIKYILETLNKKNLNNTTVLDIGCGGGLVSEGLSKIGATVTGIDFIKENIKVAKMHAKKNNLEIDYFVKDFEKEKITSKYDVIIILEVLEHLNNWEEFIKKIKLSLNKNGTLIISTINRNLVSKFLTLDIGENLLKLIPLNTHTFYKFIKPEELEQVLSSNSFENIKFKGLTYNALKLKWELSENTKINYFCSCKFI